METGEDASSWGQPQMGLGQHERQLCGSSLTSHIPPRYPGSCGLRVVRSGCLCGEGCAGVTQHIPGGPL